MDVKEFRKLMDKGKVNKKGRLQLGAEETVNGEAQPRMAENGGRTDGNGGGKKRLTFEEALAMEQQEKPKQHHVQHEEMMQMQILREMERLFPAYAMLLVHNCNEFNGTKAQGGKRKSMGIRKGFPDLSFFVPTEHYHGLHIELKCGRNKQSEEQKKYQELLEKQGYQYVVCKSVEEFINGIDKYLLLGKWM